MKTKTNVFAKRLILLIVPLVFIMSCQKDSSGDLLKRYEPTEAAYILSLLDLNEPCDSPYFVKLDFEDSELYYAQSDSHISMFPSSSSGFGNMIGRGYTFQNSSTQKSIVFTFYAPEEKPTFIFKTANYRYGNPWYSVSGVNVEFYSPTGIPNTFNMYLGTNVTNGYFWITWLDNERICGKFKTKMVECCGGDITYMVEGTFSIPRVIF